MAVRATAPDGTTWVVRRRWLPGTSTDSIWARFRRRARRVISRTEDTVDLDPGCLELAGEGIVATLALIALVLLALFVVIPLLVALAEVAILVLLAAAILVARVVLRRPWIVEAVGGDGTVHRWDVVGWRSSGAACEAVGRHLEAGIVPPPGIAPT